MCIYTNSGLAGVVVEIVSGQLPSLIFRNSPKAAQVTLPGTPPHTSAAHVCCIHMPDIRTTVTQTNKQTNKQTRLCRSTYRLSPT